MRSPEILRLTALCAALLIAAAAQAEDDPYFSSMPVVASVSRLPQRLADAPTAVTVIDREMIRSLPIRDLNDVFRLVPGFQTYPNTTEAARVTYHGLTDASFRRACRCWSMAVRCTRRPSATAPTGR